LKLKWDILVSKFASKLNLYRYVMVAAVQLLRWGAVQVCESS
jgi:hypothetical protein